MFSLLSGMVALSCLSLLACSGASAQGQVSLRTETKLNGIPTVTMIIPSPAPGVPAMIMNIPGALPFNSTVTATGEHHVILTNALPGTLSGGLLITYNAGVSIEVNSQGSNGGTTLLAARGPFNIGAENEPLPFSISQGGESTIKLVTTPASGSCTFTPQALPTSDPNSSTITVKGTATTSARVAAEMNGIRLFDLSNSDSKTANAYWLKQ